MATFTETRPNGPGCEPVCRSAIHEAGSFTVEQDPDAGADAAEAESPDAG